jgi:hypothetical protein
MRDDIDYAALRRRVEEGVRRDKRRLRLVMLSVSAFLYVLFVAIALALASTAFLSNAATGALTMLIVGWGVTLFLQGMTFAADTAAGERQMRQQAMAREIQRIFEQRAFEEAAYLERKAKRGGRLEVSDDGELIEIVDENQADAELREAVLREQLKRGN